MATCDSIYQLPTKTKEPSSQFTMKITDKENPLKSAAQDFQFIRLKTVPLCQQQQKRLVSKRYPCFHCGRDERS